MRSARPGDLPDRATTLSVRRELHPQYVLDHPPTRVGGHDRPVGTSGRRAEVKAEPGASCRSRQRRPRRVDCSTTTSRRADLFLTSLPSCRARLFPDTVPDQGCSCQLTGPGIGDDGQSTGRPAARSTAPSPGASHLQPSTQGVAAGGPIRLVRPFATIPCSTLDLRERQVSSPSARGRRPPTHEGLSGRCRRPSCHVHPCTIRSAASQNA